jgi:hypothetical protein
VTSPESDPRSTPAKAKAPWWLYAIVAAVFVLCAIAITRSTDQGPTDAENRDDAKRACQEKFIPSRLKAPATAEFSDVTVTVAGATYEVAGTVDSENAFGAKVRASFSCTMHSDADRWVLDSASVDG